MTAIHLTFFFFLLFRIIIINISADLKIIGIIKTFNFVDIKFITYNFIILSMISGYYTYLILCFFLTSAMKILKIFVLAGASFLSILLTSCQHEPELISGTAEVCFDYQVLPIIQSSCAMSGCHDGSGRLEAINSYESISKLVTPGKPIKSKLHKVITANSNSESFMPPKSKGTLSSTQINIISLWILQGANHTTCTGQECDSVNVTFTGSILPITDTYCKNCHSGGEPAGGLILDDYATIKTAVEGGRFIGAIDQLEGFSPMPQGMNKLSVCNIAQLKKWISDGMPNN